MRISEERKEKLKSNIWKFYLYRFITNLSFIEPIFTIYLLSRGLSLTQVMILQALFTASILFFNIPTGVFADLYGRKNSIIISNLLSAISLLIFGIGTTFLHFLIGELIFALAASFWIGPDTVFLYETLTDLGKERKFKKYQGKSGFIGAIAVAIGSLLGGVIAAINMPLVFFLTAISTFIGMFIPLSFTEPRRHEQIETFATHLKQAVKYSIHHPRLKYFLAFSALFGTVMFVFWMLIQPYMLELNLDLAYFGVVYAMFFVVGSIGGLFVHSIEKKLKEKKFLYLITSLAVLLLIFLSFTSELLFGISILMLLSFVGGAVEPIVMHYINHNTPSKMRATILSFEGNITSLLFSAVSPLFGWLADFYSLSTAFLACAILLSFNLIVLYASYHIKKLYVKGVAA